MNDKPFATGHCLCGEIQYTINCAPIRSAQCHCDDCQRASGTGHMSLAFFNTEDVVISGIYKEFASTADSGNINTRAFCPKCGCRLFGRNSARPTVIAVTAGTIDDNSWFTPESVVYSRNQPVWDLVAQDIPKFEAMPPPPVKKT